MKKILVAAMAVVLGVVVFGCKNEEELKQERRSHIWELGKMYLSVAKGDLEAPRWADEACARFDCTPADRQEAIKNRYTEMVAAGQPMYAYGLFNLLDSANSKDLVKIFDMAAKQGDRITMEKIATRKTPVIDLERQKYWADQQCAWYAQIASVDIDRRIAYGEDFFRLYRKYGSCEEQRHDMGIRLAREYMRQGDPSKARDALCRVGIMSFDACPEQLFHELNIPPYVTASLKNHFANGGCPH